MTLLGKRLYKIAEDNNVNIHYLKLRKIKSLSIPSNIGINKKEEFLEKDLNTCIAHELGHCLTGSFYTNKSKYETKERMEQRADRWAIDAIIPFDKFSEALKSGLTEAYVLAEYFEVSEDLIKKAYTLYEENLKI